MIALGVLDRDVPSAVALKTPVLYRDGIERVFLNKRVFWAWMVEGIAHAVLVAFLPMAALGYMNVLSTGEAVGIWDLGVIVFLSVITVVSLRLAVQVVDWQWIITALLLGSLVFWWLTWVIFNYWLSLAASIFGSFMVLPESSRFWFTYLLTTVACFVVTFTHESISVYFYPRRSQIVREQLNGYGGEEGKQKVVQISSSVEQQQEEGEAVASVVAVKE